MINNHITLGENKIKVVYDCGNGTTSIIAKKTYSYQIKISNIYHYMILLMEISLTIYQILLLKKILKI